MRLIDLTCFVYEKKLVRAIKHSTQILKKISKSYPGTDKINKLWAQHEVLWTGIREIMNLYSMYMDSDKK